MRQCQRTALRQCQRMPYDNGKGLPHKRRQSSVSSSSLGISPLRSTTSQGRALRITPFSRNSPNNRNRFGDTCPEELYDSFIGAKDFAAVCNQVIGRFLPDEATNDSPSVLTTVLQHELGTAPGKESRQRQVSELAEFLRLSDATQAPGALDKMAEKEKQKTRKSQSQFAGGLGGCPCTHRAS